MQNHYSSDLMTKTTAVTEIAPAQQLLAPEVVAQLESLFASVITEAISEGLAEAVAEAVAQTVAEIQSHRG